MVRIVAETTVNASAIVIRPRDHRARGYTPSGVIEMFADRADAGRRLAAVIEERIRGRDADGAQRKEKTRVGRTVVLGIPRGGVIVAAEVARALGLPLRVAVAAKVGAPGNPEYAVGAVAADGEVFVNPSAGYSRTQVEAMAGEARSKVEREVARWASGPRAPRVSGATAILVDDGLATGLTARAAAEWLRRQGAARVIVAAPVAPPDTVAALERTADEVIVVEEPEWFSAVGQFYGRFGQTDDAEVDAALRASAITSP